MRTFFRIHSFCVAKYYLRANKMRNLGCFGTEAEENVQPGGKLASEVFVLEPVLHKLRELL